MSYQTGNAVDKPDADTVMKYIIFRHPEGVIKILPYKSVASVFC